MNQTKEITLFILLTAGALGGCRGRVAEVEADHPPAHLKGSLLYFRPKEQFWMLWKPSSIGSGETRCTFWDITGGHLEFSCSYDLPANLRQTDMDDAWFAGPERDLRLGNNRIIPCHNLRTHEP